MIDEEATFRKFRYYSTDLPLHSGKPILAACDDCAKVRVTTKHDYCALCRSCASKGNTKALGRKHTEEAKALISKNHADFKGKNHPNFGVEMSEEQKAKIGAANTGKKNGNWNGGKKIVTARHDAKRKQFGYTLLMPLKDGEEGHHVTDEYVIGIPAEVHKRFSGYKKRKHRTKVLQWLKANNKRKYKMVLCILAKELSK